MGVRATLLVVLLLMPVAGALPLPWSPYTASDGWRGVLGEGMRDVDGEPYDDGRCAGPLTVRHVTLVMDDGSASDRLVLQVHTANGIILRYATLTSAAWYDGYARCIMVRGVDVETLAWYHVIEG